MAKLIIEKKNGERIVVRDDLPEYVSPYSFLYRDDYPAIKVLSKDFIRHALLVEGYEGTEDEVDSVACAGGDWDGFVDYSDGDWYCVGYAIQTAQINGDLPEVNEDESNYEGD